MPDWMFKAIARAGIEPLVDSHFVDRNLGKSNNYDNSKLLKELGPAGALTCLPAHLHAVVLQPDRLCA
jgi:hypothetical protein